MLKLLLILSLLISSELLQASLLQSMRGSIDHFRSVVAREVARWLALSALREMMRVELNSTGMAMLNDIDVGFVIGDEQVTAEVLAELMVCEYNMRMTALTQGKLATAEPNVLAKVQEQELVTLTTEMEHLPSLAKHSKCQDVVCLGIHGWDRKLAIVDAMVEHGSDMSFEELRQRFRQRWRIARGSFKEISEPLSHVSLHQAQLEKLTDADLQVGWNITSQIIVPKLGHTLSPGLVILAKVYEFAARVFALEGKEDLVKLSLLSMLTIKESPDDNIIMTVSTSADSYPMRLTHNSLDEIAALYLEQVN